MRDGHNGRDGYTTMINQLWLTEDQAENHKESSKMRICICVRKRPMFDKERVGEYFDCVSTCNPTIRVHEPKVKVDGITKYVDTTDFKFDNVYGDMKSTESLYQTMINPVLENLFNQGIVTCFAYGQTGSGKTYTMKGVQGFSINDLFSLGEGKYAEEEPYFTASFFEIYGGKLFDLLNNKRKLVIREDYNNKFQISGIKTVQVNTPNEMLEVLEHGNASRATQATHANDESSRSHAVCQVNIYSAARRGAKLGQLMLVDLAGSE